MKLVFCHYTEIMNARLRCYTMDSLRLFDCSNKLILSNTPVPASIVFRDSLVSTHTIKSVFPTNLKPESFTSKVVRWITPAHGWVFSFSLSFSIALYVLCFGSSFTRAFLF